MKMKQLFLMNIRLDSVDRNNLNDYNSGFKFKMQRSHCVRVDAISCDMEDICIDRKALLVSCVSISFKGGGGGRGLRLARVVSQG